MKVFISYSRVDCRKARNLAKAIKAEAIDVWYDQWDVLVGRNLADQIYEGIRSSDYLLLLLTQASSCSRWVREELNFAKALELESGGTRIVPLLYEDCDVPDPIKGRAFVDFRSSFRRGFNSLLRFLKADFATKLHPKRNLSQEIKEPLGCHALLTFILFYGIGATANKDDLTPNALPTLRDIVARLTQLAKAHDVEKRCYDWLQTVLEIAEHPERSRCSSPRDAIFNLWNKGVALYRGGLYRQLSMVSKVAFEIGNGIANLADRSEWLERSKYIFETLGFSNKFRVLVSREGPMDRLLDALIIELGRLQDFGKLRIYHSRRTQSNGLWAGFNLLLAGLLDNKAHLSYHLSLVAEYLLSEIGEIDECEKLLDLATTALKDNTQEDLAERLFASHLRLLDLTRAKAQSLPGARAFLLGLLVGRLLVGNDQEVLIDSDVVLDADRMAEELHLEDTLKTELKDILDSSFYVGPVPPNVLVQFIQKTSNSFAEGRSGV